MSDDFPTPKPRDREVPDLELEVERRAIELERGVLELTPQGRVMLSMANRLLTISERLRIHAQDEERRFDALERRLQQLEGERTGNGAFRAQ